jgi:hypothetical protein
LKTLRGDPRISFFYVDVWISVATAVRIEDQRAAYDMRFRPLTASGDVDEAAKGRSAAILGNRTVALSFLA